MNKIICMGDILYHSLEYLHKKSYWWTHNLFKPIIVDAVSDSIQVTYDILDSEDVPFSREYFYKLGGIKNIKYCYQDYKVENFNNEQISYLKRFFSDNTIIIGWELYKPFSDLLSSFGCQIIDLAFHPFKLLNDISYGIYTNNINIYNKLLSYQVSQNTFYYSANYWKTFINYENTKPNKNIEENSCIFIGQTMIDKSVEKDGIFLNVTHFEDKLKELSKQYSKVYYIPHPYLGRKRKVIYDFIKKCPYIELLENCSTYELLASDKVKKVVAISTSVLYEAQYFGKEIEYLYRPLFNIDVPFEEHSYISIHEDYWNPRFWADILSPICDVKKDVKDVNYFKGKDNMIRNIGNMYWGYAQLDPIKRIPTFKESIKDLYRQYIAPLF